MHAIRRCCTSFFSIRCAGLFLTALLFGAGLRSMAQTVGPANDVSVEPAACSDEIAEVQPTWFSNSAMDTQLPDAPEPQRVGQSDQDGQRLVAAVPTKTVPSTTNMPVAPMYSRVIPAGEATPQIHRMDKIALAARNLYSPTSFADFFVSAGWSHLLNRQPNYGTDSGAFGERLGAAAIRDSSQSFLSNGPFAVWLHQDPRYFALGPGHSFGRRTLYAITRPLITRDSSDGHAVFNSSLIAGQAAGTALANLYYPQSNRNFRDNLASFGSSMGGSALSFVLDEYTSEILRAMHLRRAQRLLQ
jgi:hypothetical protein